MIDRTVRYMINTLGKYVRKTDIKKIRDRFIVAIKGPFMLNEFDTSDM